MDHYNQRLEEALQRLEEVGELSDNDLKEVRYEIRHLEERLHFWREVSDSVLRSRYFLGGARVGVKVRLLLRLQLR